VLFRESETLVVAILPGVGRNPRRERAPGVSADRSRSVLAQRRNMGKTVGMTAHIRGARGNL
jgi:hypothetical protein